MSKMSNTAYKHVKVTPIEQYIIDNNELMCGICFDGNTSQIRECCGKIYCNHCYTKFKKCPNSECSQVTRQDKTNGGSVIMISVSGEHNECRICLDPGKKRLCCGNYYCDDCYYSKPKCRSCKTYVGKKSYTAQFNDITVSTVILGYLFTLCVIGSLAGILVIIITNEAITPIGLYQYKCYGIFPQCDLNICANMSSQIILANQALPALSSWKACDLNSEVKLRGLGCIYDKQMYSSSSRTLGYDVCESKFNNGLYIFEDDFENWKETSSFQSNLMKSAKWDIIQNGEPADYCGVPVGSSLALTFSGRSQRFAMTQPLNVSTGGQVQALLFLAPLDYQLSHPKCQATYSSYVSVDYSLDGGKTWTAIEYFNAYQYRQKSYFSINVEIPQKASTESTQFRFYQNLFNADYDNWAIDDVKIATYLTPKWKSSQGFLASLTSTIDSIKLAQCCYDTNWCVKRLSLDELKQCHNYSWWYPESTSNYKLRDTELIVIICFILNIIKFIYISLQDWYMRKRFPFQDEIREILLVDFFYKYLPPQYRPKHGFDDFISNLHLSVRLTKQLNEDADDEEEKAAQGHDMVDTTGEGEKKALYSSVISFFTCSFNKAQSDDANNDNLTGDIDNKVMTVSKSKPKKKGFKKKDNSDRQEINFSKIGFDIRSSSLVTSSFAYITSSIWLILFFYKMFTTPYFGINQTVYPYNIRKETLTVTSGAIVLFAMYNDLKEIFHAIKYIIPYRKKWLPFITVDLTENVNSLFIGRYQIKMSDVLEVYPFTRLFIQICYLNYYFTCFPWCLFMITMRDSFLSYYVMRVVVPIMGTIIILRSLLGSSCFLKLFLALEYVFDIDMKKREKIGLALQSSKSLIGAAIGSLTISIFITFICSIVYLPMIGTVFGFSFAFGLLYGYVNGFYHSSPLRPWMYLTVLESGVFIRLKKKEECFLRRGKKCCADLHQSDELLFVFTKDDIKFQSIMKNGLGLGAT